MSFQKIFKLFSPYRHAIAIMAVFSLLVSLISAVTPFVSSFLIDKGLIGGSTPILLCSIFTLTALNLFSHFLQYLQTKQEIQITNDLGRHLKVSALEHGLRLKPSDFQEEGFYKTIEDALFDIEHILTAATGNCMMIVMMICKAVGAAFGLFFLNIRLTLLILPLIPIKFLWNQWMRQKAEALGKESVEAKKVYHTWFSDILSGIFDIKLWNLTSRKISEYSAHTDRINDTSKMLLLFHAKNTRIIQMIEFIFLQLLYLPGAFWIEKGELSLGTFMAFLSFSSYLLLPVDALMDLRTLLMQIKPSIEGLQKFFARKEENYTSKLLPQTPVHTIEFRDVSVTFEGREILSHINFTAHRGEKIAVVGDNGCGKSTLLWLLLGFLCPSSGEILMDGTPIFNFQIDAYRKLFSVVSQKIHLFRGSVRENITVDHTKLLPLSSYPSFCTNVIEKLEKQLETTVGFHGDKLSGGEKQKIAFLRAFNRKTQILILDEATSNYDSRSETEFYHFLKENNDYGFYFIISHRTELLSFADKILHL